MLRNFYPPVRVVEICLLNEVLSLNAQESREPQPKPHTTTFLNEVLSLNAQESRRTIRRPCWPTFLNEVLSLNAQECARAGC